MALRNAFENLGLDSTLQAIRDRLPAALGGSGGIKVEQQGPVTVTQGTASNLKVDLSGTGANATAIKVDGSAVTQPVSGTFWQATQPVSGTVTANQGGIWDIRNVSGTVSLPTGAATSANQSTANTSLGNLDTNLGAKADSAATTDTGTFSLIALTKRLLGKFPSLGQTTMSGSTPVAIASDQSAVPISAASLPLPSGASTSAKQPALGTAGTPASDVLSIQGITSMTPIKVDGSAATQPVSGTVTANAGTNLNTSALALESGGNLATLAGGVTASVYQANVKQINGVTPLMGNGASGTGAQRVTIANDSTGKLSTVDTITNVVHVDDNSGSLTVDGTVTVTQGTASNLKVDLSGTAANSTAIKVDGSAVTQPVSGTVTSNLGATTSSGLTTYRLLAAASTNGNSIKASAGKVYGWYLYNNAAYACFVKLYNKASSPTVGSDTPFITIPLPSNSGANTFSDIGIPFSTGIALAITTGVADADTAATAANDVVVNLFYA